MQQWIAQSNPCGSGQATHQWAVYRCMTCGWMVLDVAPFSSQKPTQDIIQIWPSPPAVAETVPDRAREYLSQAMASLHAPSGAVILTASSVDAMLKVKGLKEGTLNARVDKAATAHLITDEMATWAHEIRLDANELRHADESSTLPSREDAEKVIEFANALAQFLFVLSARVERGRKG